MDEDTKQLLRDILATQREQLVLSQRLAEDQKKLLDSYAADSASYRQSIAEWKLNNTASRWANVIRVLTMAGIVILLGYVVLFGLHAR